MVLILIPDIKKDPGAPEMSMDLNIRKLFVLPRRIWSKELSPHDHEPLTLSHPIENVIVSWTKQLQCETEGECVRALWDLQKRYQALGQDIPYNFVVGGDSTVYECRGWHARPAPCERHPELDGKSIEIAHVGTKRKDGRRPVPGMTKAVTDLCDLGIKNGYVVDIPGYYPDYDIWYGVDITEEQKKNFLEWELEEELKKPDRDNYDIPNFF